MKVIYKYCDHNGFDKNLLTHNFSLCEFLKITNKDTNMNIKFFV